MIVILNEKKVYSGSSPRNTPSFLYGCDLFFVDVSVILEIPEEGCNDGSYYGHAGHQQEEGVPAEMVRVPA